MERLELLIPPPVVMLLTGLIMWLLSNAFPAFALHWAHSDAPAIVIGILGVAVSLAGVATFKRASTTIDPRHPAETSTVVSSGIYRFSRNPMYLGILLVLAGWAVYLANVLSALCVLIFVAYITRYQIMPEERVLREKFGAEFTAYQSKVRRWL
jgi:protein-S-isoprenylcysteine O-methyltransferase Ste14